MALSKPDQPKHRPGPYCRNPAVDPPMSRKGSVEARLARRGSADSFELPQQG